MPNCAHDNTYNRGETKNTVIDGGRYALLIVIQDKKNEKTFQRSTLANLTGSTLDLKTFGESWGRSSKFGMVGNTSQQCTTCLIFDTCLELYINVTFYFFFKRKHAVM